jgi:hypothetical protein
MRHPSQAARLTTSACQKCEHHGIARRDFHHIRSYALDDARAFVAKHNGMRYGVDLIAGNHIRVAQTRGDNLDQYFIAARAFQA